MVAALQGTVEGLALDLDTARHMVERIQEHLTRADYHANQARKLILDLREQEGWRVLGYPSWRECVMNEFERRSSTVYRQLNAALVELELSPAGGNVGEINERVLRPLTKRGLDEDARHFVWQVCEKIVGPGGKITSGVTEQVVDGLIDMLRSETVQMPGGEQYRLSEAMEADLIARVRETKIAHKEHIRQMDAKRDYILGGVKIDKITRGQMEDGRVAILVSLDDIQRAKIMEAAKRKFYTDKPIFIALWVEE